MAITYLRHFKNKTLFRNNDRTQSNEDVWNLWTILQKYEPKLTNHCKQFVSQHFKNDLSTLFVSG